MDADEPGDMDEKLLLKALLLILRIYFLNGMVNVISKLSYWVKGSDYFINKFIKLHSDKHLRFDHSNIISQLLGNEKLIILHIFQLIFHDLFFLINF